MPLWPTLLFNYLKVGKQTDFLQHIAWLEVFIKCVFDLLPLKVNPERILFVVHNMGDSYNIIQVYNANCYTSWLVKKVVSFLVGYKLYPTIKLTLTYSYGISNLIIRYK